MGEMEKFTCRRNTFTMFVIWKISEDRTCKAYTVSYPGGRNEVRISRYPAVPCILCDGILYDRFGEKPPFGVRFPNRIMSDFGKILDFPSSDENSIRPVSGNPQPPSRRH